MRRVFWGLVGIGLGAVVGAQVVRWANKTKQRYSPPNIAREATGKLAELKDRLAEAVAAGAEEMAQREVELRVELGLPIH
jgi:hypothetical protein